ncbi:MAG: FHA domain-containing protein [Chloroflexi bacterium]|nr:FHA domain-containing protein [Chloroflexota bacterium]
MASEELKRSPKQSIHFISNLDPDDFGQTVLNDDWLRDQSQSHLIDAVKILATRLQGQTTEKIKTHHLPDVSFKLPQTPLHLEFVSDEIVVPASARTQTREAEFEWELLLFPNKSNELPVRLRVLGDFTIGRAKGPKSPDLDLSPLGADAQGVSRSHAAIHATPDALFLVDLGSTNGTYYKARKLKTGDPVELHERGSVAFGSLVFSIARMQRKH